MNIALEHMATAAVLSLACANGFTADSENASRAASAKPIQFEMETFVMKSGDCREQQDNCATISMTYPVAAGGTSEAVTAINERILRNLVDSLGAQTDDGSRPPSLEQAADRFLGEYEDFASAMDSHPMGWFVETKAEVAFQSRKLAVLSLDTYSSTGGAHPNSYTVLFNFDTTTGMALGYKDFVSDVDGLKEIAQRAFRLARELPEDADLTAEGFFWDGEFKLSENFAVTHDGLRLFYNPYEAAPYAMGPTGFVIPWSELEGVIVGKIF